MGAKTVQIAVNRREAEGFLLWSNCSRFGWGKASPLQVVNFVRDKKDQSKPAPARAYRGLRWLRRVSGLEARWRPDGGFAVCAAEEAEKTDLAPAQIPSIEMLKGMGLSVFSATTGPLRCVAGFVCCLAWGCV